MTEYFYYYDDRHQVVYWSEEMSERTDIVFLGSSLNPNKKHAVAVLVQPFGIPRGWKIRQLD
jgi:hypothetical protein